MHLQASTEYLNLLADVFVKALSRTNAGGGANSTQLFHLLLPALCHAFLDSLLLGRDCLAKRAVANTGIKGDALLQDDGFAVGVAFILRVFGLNRDFQSLHWFQTEINDSDMTTGQARAAAGLPYFTDSNQSLAIERPSWILDGKNIKELRYNSESIVESCGIYKIPYILINSLSKD